MVFTASLLDVQQKGTVPPPRMVDRWARGKLTQKTEIDISSPRQTGVQKCNYNTVVLHPVAQAIGNSQQIPNQIPDFWIKIVSKTQKLTILRS